jgi:hypothetical protein
LPEGGRALVLCANLHTKFHSTKREWPKAIGAVA